MENCVDSLKTFLLEENLIFKYRSLISLVLALITLLVITNLKLKVKNLNPSFLLVLIPLTVFVAVYLLISLVGKNLFINKDKLDSLTKICQEMSDSDEYRNIRITPRMIVSYASLHGYDLHSHGLYHQDKGNTVVNVEVNQSQDNQNVETTQNNEEPQGNEGTQFEEPEVSQPALEETPFNVPEIPQIPQGQLPQVPEVPQVPEIPQVPEVPQVPQIPENQMDMSAQGVPVEPSSEYELFEPFANNDNAFGGRIKSPEYDIVEETLETSPCYSSYPFENKQKPSYLNARIIRPCPGPTCQFPRIESASETANRMSNNGWVERCPVNNKNFTGNGSN